jgi:hypothetical protein
MRIDSVNISSVQGVFPAKVNPVVSATEASKSGVRPEDLNKLMKMTTYNENGKTQQTTMIRNFADIFSGAKVDTRA